MVCCSAVGGKNCNGVGWKATNRWESACMHHKTEIAREQPFPPSKWWKKEEEEEEEKKKNSQRTDNRLWWRSQRTGHLMTLVIHESHHSMSFSFLFLWLHVFPSLKADEGEKIEKKTLRQKKKKSQPENWRNTWVRVRVREKALFFQTKLRP